MWQRLARVDSSLHREARTRRGLRQTLAGSCGRSLQPEWSWPRPVPRAIAQTEGLWSPKDFNDPRDTTFHSGSTVPGAWGRGPRGRGSALSSPPRSVGTPACKPMPRGAVWVATRVSALAKSSGERRDKSQPWSRTPGCAGRCRQVAKPGDAGRRGRTGLPEPRCAREVEAGGLAGRAASEWGWQ